MINQDIPKGTVLISRNKNNSLNHGYSYWNHAAIYIGNNEIIEATESGVIKTNLEEYKKRDYEFLILIPKNLEIGIKSSDKSITMIGIKYRFISSIFRIQRKDRRGLNCVSVIRKSYTYALGYDPKYKTPDDIVNDTRIFYK